MNNKEETVKCRYIKDRWLTKDWPYIAIRYKGEWVAYKKADLSDVIKIMGVDE